jgi:hypothetical protein
MADPARSRGAQILGVLVVVALVLGLALDEDAGVHAVQAFLCGLLSSPPWRNRVAKNDLYQYRVR